MLAPICIPFPPLPLSLPVLVRPSYFLIKRYDSICCSVSNTTATRISSEVPPKNNAKPSLTPILAIIPGKIAISPKKIEPGNVTLVVNESIYSCVSVPGLIPGMKEFCLFKCSAYCWGFTISAV